MRRSLALSLILSMSCAEVQMRSIGKARGPWVSAAAWAPAEQLDLARKVAAGEVVAVDDEGRILSDCTIGGRYGTRGGETALIQVERLALPEGCDQARVVTGFTTVDGALASISFAALAPLIVETKLDPGDVDGEWILRDPDGGLLCKLPCTQYLLPHPNRRAGYVERTDAVAGSTVADVPWDPLSPGSEVDLTLKVERPAGAWPYIPIVQLVVGLGGAAIAGGVLATGDLSGNGTSVSGRVGSALAAPILLGLVGVVGLALGIHGIWWLASPPEPTPLLRAGPPDP